MCEFHRYISGKNLILIYSISKYKMKLVVVLGLLCLIAVLEVNARRHEWQEESGERGGGRRHPHGKGPRHGRGRHKGRRGKHGKSSEESGETPPDGPPSSGGVPPLDNTPSSGGVTPSGMPPTPPDGNVPSGSEPPTDVQPPFGGTNPEEGEIPAEIPTGSEIPSDTEMTTPENLPMDGSTMPEQMPIKQAPTA